MSGVLTPAPNFQLEIHVDQQHIHDGKAFDTSSPSVDLLNRRATTSSSLCSSPMFISPASIDAQESDLPSDTLEPRKPV
jgi:hypothetical protein